MKTYWDSSAVINAAVSSHVATRLDTGEHFVRLHALAEFFATMTGRGIKVLDAHGKSAQFKFSPQDAAKWLRSFSTKVKLVDLTLDESLDAIDETQKRGIQGARIHDFLHAVAADKRRATNCSRAIRTISPASAMPRLSGLKKTPFPFP